MFNKTTDRIGDLFELLVKMTHNDSPFQENGKEKNNIFFRNERAIKIFIAASFFMSLIVTFMLYFEAPQSCVPKEWVLIFFVLIFCLSSVVFISFGANNNVNGIKISNGFSYPKISEFRDDSRRDFGFIKELCKCDKKELEIALIQYNNKWIADYVFIDFIFDKPILFPAVIFFVSFLLIDSTRENFAAGFLMVSMFMIAVILFLYYGWLNTRLRIGKKQRHSHVVRLLKLAIRLKQTEKQEAITPATPPIPALAPEKPTGLLGRLLRDICK